MFSIILGNTQKILNIEWLLDLTTQQHLTVLQDLKIGIV